MYCFQFYGKIYYRSLCDISPGTELLVFYGEEYAKELGIGVKKATKSEAKQPQISDFPVKTNHTTQGIDKQHQGKI